MIKEPALWRSKLLTYADELEAVCERPWDNSEQRIFDMEHLLLVSAATATRMFGAQIISFALLDCPMPTIMYEALEGVDVGVLNRNSLMACYDLERQLRSDLTAYDVYNNLRHAFVLHFSNSPIGEAFWFATLGEKRRLFRCQLSDYCAALRVIAQDYYSYSISYKYIKSKKNEHIVFNSRDTGGNEELRRFLKLKGQKIPELKLEYNRLAHILSWSPFEAPAETPPSVEHW